MLFSTARPKNIENADPYDTFKQWCLENGFSDVVHCKSKDVDLRRLNEAINQYMPANRKPPVFSFQKNKCPVIDFPKCSNEILHKNKE
jgi:hypothetical protein